MKRSTIAWIAAGSLLAAGALVWAFSPRPIEVETAAATVGPFESAIEEDAKTRVVDRYVVSAPLAGRVSRILLREGDAVEAGAVVATLMPVLSPLLDERSYREATARVAAAQAQLERARVRLERAKVATAQSRLELQRSERLALDGFIAPTRLDNDRLAAQTATREQEAAVQDQHVAEHDLEQARAVLVTLRQPAGAGGRAFDVRSPVAGQLLRVAQRSEGTVALGAPLLEVGNTDRLEVVAELLTTDALRVAAGMPVHIDRWGGAGVLEGRVRRIEPAAFTKVSALGVEEQRVNVLIDITSPRSRWQALGDGFLVSVRVVVIRAERALQLPVSAAFPLPAGAGSASPGTGVFVVNDGRARLVRVSMRARNGSTAWVDGGLGVGDEVVLYPPATVRDGTRLRVRAL